MLIEKEILVTVAYFDIFDHPLTQAEIYRFLKIASPQPQLTEALSSLVDANLLFKLGEFYSLKNDVRLVDNRFKNNGRAAKMMRTADKVAGFISCFPYVRCVAISGSLSKDVADEKADIDFFLICKKDRLWIGRTLLMLFRKLMRLLNKHQFFCMNYFIDEAGLEIEEKNLYTATEIVTLVPMRGQKTFEEFQAANEWVTAHLPNHGVKPVFGKKAKSPVIKRLAEYLFDFTVFDKLEIYLQNITSKRWKKVEEEGQKNSRGIVLSLKTSKHYAKHNPETFQFKLLAQHENKVRQLLKQLQSALHTVED